MKVCIGDKASVSEVKGVGDMFDELDSFSYLVVLNELGDICSLVMPSVDEDLLQELNINNPRKAKITIYFFIILHSPNNSGINKFFLTMCYNIYNQSLLLKSYCVKPTKMYCGTKLSLVN